MKSISTFFSFIVFFSASLKSQQAEKYSFTWPENYLPEKSKFFVHNEIEINASADKIWSILLDVYQWPTWYEGASQVKLLYPNETQISAQSVILWKTMGMYFKSSIKQFEPNKILAWESYRKNIQGYHMWLILQNSNGTCRVITDESQLGWLTFFERIFQPKKLHRLHDVWLRELKHLAESK